MDSDMLEMPTVLGKLTPLGGSTHFQACTRYLMSPAVRLMLEIMRCIMVDVVWLCERYRRWSAKYVEGRGR